MNLSFTACFLPMISNFKKNEETLYSDKFNNFFSRLIRNLSHNHVYNKLKR